MDLNKKIGKMSNHGLVALLWLGTTKHLYWSLMDFFMHYIYTMVLCGFVACSTSICNKLPVYVCVII